MNTPDIDITETEEFRLRVREAVAAAPPLTPERAERLRVTLAPLRRALHARLAEPLEEAS